MPIIDSLFGPHLNNVQKALGKAGARQNLLMANLANINTPGYKRKDLDFNVVLDQAILGPGRAIERSQIGSDRTGLTTALRNDGNNVDMEREIFAIAETETRFQVLTEMANRHFSGLKHVIREGR